MSDITRRLRELTHDGVDVCVVTGPRGASYRVYSEDGMCLEDGALAAGEVMQLRAFGVRVEDAARAPSDLEIAA